MDMRVLLMSADRHVADLIRAQVENLGCRTTVASSFEAASGALDWAEAAIVDLAGEAVDDLLRLRVAVPSLPILAVARDELEAAPARHAWVSGVLVEPFSITELVTAVRALQPEARPSGGAVIDLRTRPHLAPGLTEDDLWWATR
jgi:DNA-binding response OmpR family regulator